MSDTAKLPKLTGTAKIIDALGGTQAVADLTGRTYAAAWNWRKFENFPPDTYLAMTTRLHQLGYTAPASLWRMAGEAAAAE